jgi:hypothetical protein
MAQMAAAQGGGAGPGAAPPGMPMLPGGEVPGNETTDAATQNVPSDVMQAMGPTPVPVA